MTLTETDSRITIFLYIETALSYSCQLTLATNERNRCNFSIVHIFYEDYYFLGLIRLKIKLYLHFYPRFVFMHEPKEPSVQTLRYRACLVTRAKKIKMK